MSEEEKKAMEDQYKKGLVNLENIIEPLIRQFKNDYSLDIQQLRLVTNYLLLERDFDEEYYSELDRELEKLQKEIESQKELDKIQRLKYQELLAQDFISKEKIKQLLKEKEKQYEIYVGREYSGMGELVAEIKILEKILGDQI